jgi:hypothetical protein
MLTISHWLKKQFQRASVNPSASACKKKNDFFLFKLIFFIFLNHFDILISKIILKNKKYIILIHF